MDSPASTPSQRQPHWIHSRLTPEHLGQPQKGRTTNTNVGTGALKPIPAHGHQRPKDNWHTPKWPN